MFLLAERKGSANKAVVGSIITTMADLRIKRFKLLEFSGTTF